VLPIQPDYLLLPTSTDLTTGTAFPNFQTTPAGLGDTGQSDTSVFSYRMTFIMDSGSESPMSAPAFVTWTIPVDANAERRFGIFVNDIPLGPKGCVARRIDRTKNQRLGNQSSAQEGIYYFVKNRQIYHLFESYDNNITSFSVSKLGEKPLIAYEGDFSPSQYSIGEYDFIKDPLICAIERKRLIEFFDFNKMEYIKSIAPFRDFEYISSNFAKITNISKTDNQKIIKSIISNDFKVLVLFDLGYEELDPLTQQHYDEDEIEENIDNKGYIPRPTDQTLKFGILFQDYMPNLPSVKLYMNLVYNTGLPGGSPSYADPYLYQNKMRDYRRADVGFFKVFTDNNKNLPKGHWLKKFKDLSAGMEIFNLFNNMNAITNTWVRDVYTKNQYGIPNYMTTRVFNFKISAKF
jgi:hypothetical protein